MNHDIDCDMGEDCTCPAGEEEHPICPGCGERHPPPVVVRAGSFTMVMPAWAFELLRDAGLGFEQEPTLVSVEHPEFGDLEL